MDVGKLKIAAGAAVVLSAGFASATYTEKYAVWNQDQNGAEGGARMEEWDSMFTECQYWRSGAHIQARQLGDMLDLRGHSEDGSTPEERAQQNARRALGKYATEIPFPTDRSS